jgi:hypothetical protein
MSMERTIGGVVALVLGCFSRLLDWFLFSAMPMIRLIRPGPYST